MNALVIDASVAIKWVIEEPGTSDALMLRGGTRLMAPDLVVAECASILWKKAHRRELTRDEAVLAARLLETADVELLPTRSLLQAATQLAVDLDHPAYDCLYLASAIANGCRFVTADETFVDKLKKSHSPEHREVVMSLGEAAATLKR